MTYISDGQTTLNDTTTNKKGMWAAGKFVRDSQAKGDRLLGGSLAFGEWNVDYPTCTLVVGNANNRKHKTTEFQQNQWSQFKKKENHS
jgi:hypothetical protein